jgi:hypothetical protein
MQSLIYSVAPHFNPSPQRKPKSETKINSERLADKIRIEQAFAQCKQKSKWKLEYFRELEKKRMPTKKQNGDSNVQGDFVSPSRNTRSSVKRTVNTPSPLVAPVSVQSIVSKETDYVLSDSEGSDTEFVPEQPAAKPKRLSKSPKTFVSPLPPPPIKEKQKRKRPPPTPIIPQIGIRRSTKPGSKRKMAEKTPEDWKIFHARYFALLIDPARFDPRRPAAYGLMINTIQDDFTNVQTQIEVATAFENSP